MWYAYGLVVVVEVAFDLVEDCWCCERCEGGVEIGVEVVDGFY